MDQIEYKSASRVPHIVAVETSGSAGSVALAAADCLFAETALSSTRRHAADLLPAIDRLCRDAGCGPQDLDQCHLSIGPGSFTGLRVAVTFARHLALATGARIVAVPTLDVIAEEARQHVPTGAHLAVILDAKRGQVFGALYCHTGEDMAPLSPPRLTDPAELLSTATRPCWVTGEGIAYHAAAVAQSGLPCIAPDHRLPRARSVHRLGWKRALRGEFAPPETLTPLYVRIPEAEEIWARRHQAQ